MTKLQLVSAWREARAWVAISVLCFCFLSTGYFVGQVKSDLTHSHELVLVTDAYKSSSAAKDQVIAKLSTSSATATQSAAVATTQAAKSVAQASQATQAASDAVDTAVQASQTVKDTKAILKKAH